MKGNIDIGNTGEHPGIGITSHQDRLDSGETLTKVRQAVAKDGPTCAKASRKSLCFWANFPQVDHTLTHLPPEVAKVSQKSISLWANWPQSGQTLVNLPAEVAKDGVKPTHFAPNWSRFPETLQSSQGQPGM